MKSLMHALKYCVVMPVCFSSFSSVALSAEGFSDGAEGDLELRNYYLNRDFKDNGRSRVDPGPNHRGMAEEWTQSFIFDVQSGFTPGVIGFGVDVLGTFAIKLDGGRGTYGTQLLPTHDGNDPADNFGRLGLAAKARMGQTVLKVGEWSPVLPILKSNESRALPQSFKGAMLTSRDFKDVTLYAGQFNSNSQRNDASMEKMSLMNAGKVIHSGNTVESDHFNFAGAEYTFNKKRTMAGFWYAQLEDIYHQQYFQLRHSQTLADDFTFSMNLNLFLGDEDGQALAGEQRNRTASGLFSLTRGPHRVSIGLQKVSGPAQFQRISGTSGGTLANDTYGWAYDGIDERSWQVRYDFDFAAVGVPGLTAMARFIKGTDIDYGTVRNGEDRGTEAELAYTVQSGTFKKLNVRLRSYALRRDYGSTNSFNENRVMISYPLSLF